jgi:hypothetical protein
MKENKTFGCAAAIKSFCGGVQGGQFFQKAPPLVAEGIRGLPLSCNIV